MGIVTDVILPIALAFIMFSLGLGLTLEDFSRVAKQPRDFLVGAVSQIVLLPIVAFFLVSLWPLTPEIALGVMIIAAAPGGVTSNILTSFAKGDVALSISLTAAISLLSVVTIPFIVVLSYNHFVGESLGEDLSIAKTAVSIFVIVTVPVIGGLAVRHFMSSFAIRLETLAKRIATILFILVLVGAIAKERVNIAEYFAQAGLVTLVLNLTMMLLAYTMARLFASGLRQRIAIAIECGLQNGTLAIAVAVTLFGGGVTVIPAATYSLIMFATSLIFILLMRKSDAQRGKM
jgi:BASS family bile acid:Na+ symporter